jgi:hypothetical protein
VDVGGVEVQLGDLLPVGDIDQAHGFDAAVGGQGRAVGAERQGRRQ